MSLGPSFSPTPCIGYFPYCHDKIPGKMPQRRRGLFWFAASERMTHHGGRGDSRLMAGACCGHFFTQSEGSASGLQAEVCTTFKSPLPRNRRLPHTAAPDEPAEDQVFNVGHFLVKSQQKDKSWPVGRALKEARLLPALRTWGGMGWSGGCLEKRVETKTGHV